MYEAVWVVDLEAPFGSVLFDMWSVAFFFELLSIVVDFFKRSITLFQELSCKELNQNKNIC